MEKIKISFFILLFLLCTKTIAIAQSKSPSILDKHIEWNKIYAENLASLIAKIAVTYRIPMSFEPNKTYMEKSTNAELQAMGKGSHFVIKDGTLKEVLDKLMELYPEYNWRLENNIVHIFPRQDSDPIINELLDIEVEDFSFQESIGRMSVGDSITNISEVKEKLQLLKTIGVHYYDNELSNKGSDSPKTVLHFSKTKVRNILNQIIKESSFKFWTIIVWGDRHFITILSH